MSEISLRDYFERRFADERRITQARFKSMEALVIAKEKDSERRIEGLNELRSDVVRDRSLFVTEEKFLAEMRSLSPRVQALERDYVSKEKQEGDHRAHGGRLAVVERWQSRVVGGMLVAALAISLIVSFLVRAFA